MLSGQRRYVFKNASVSRYKKQFLITTNYDNDDSGIQILESKFYNVVKVNWYLIQSRN